MRDLGGRRCLITGAASGIGRATALAMAAEGAELYLTDIGDAGVTETAAVAQAGGGLVAERHAMDVADFEAVTAWADRIHHDQFARLLTPPDRNLPNDRGHS